MTEKLFLIDAMAMIYRAYFAMISNPLINARGKNTSAAFGFVTSLTKILNEEKPDHIAICFDTEKPTFRHKLFPVYKAQRQEIPTDMPWQIQKVKEIVQALNIPMIELDGYEADDIIGTIANKAAKEDVITYMVTPDKDYMQLVTEKTFLYKPTKNMFGTRILEADIIGIEGVKEKFGVEPAKVIEVLGLMGDASDNIPGVKGVGEKTAIALIQEYGSIENLYANIEKITKPKLKENLIIYKAEALLSKRLATIDIETPIDVDFHNLNRKSINEEQTLKLFTELEFKSLLKKFIPDGKQIEEEPKSADISITGGKIFTPKAEPVSDNIPQREKIIKTINDINCTYKTITTEKELNALISELGNASVFAVDTETDSLNEMEANMLGISVSFKEFEAYYIPLIGDFGEKAEKEESLFSGEEKKEDVKGIEFNLALKKIKPLLENPEIKKTGQNIKYDYLIFRNYGIEMQNIHFDTLIGSFILAAEGSHDMDSLSEKYLDYKPIPISDIIGKGKNQITMAEAPLDAVSQYAAEDADVTFRLYEKLKYELRKNSLITLCEEIEFPLIKVLAEMEFAGIRIDTKVLKTIDAELSVMISEYEEKIHRIAGEQFNINSTQQLSKILFEKLKLKPVKKTKTGFSTDVSVLEELKGQHEIAALLVDYRMLSKLKSTYTEGLIKSVNPKTKRVHTSFNQIGATTGRISSVNPNLQNIPIRTEAGRAIRKAFVPENDEYVILSADYSQIELRIMAHCSGDENMLNAFKNKSDIHTETAIKIFNLESKTEVTANMRRKAKEVNFGIIYGIGAFGLASRLDIRNNEAKEIISLYFEKYPKAKEYMESTKKFARENGYVETLFKRRRYLSQINNQNAAARAEDERAAINMPIQGTAADMIKIAMVNIYNELMGKGLKSRMLIQVHDELVFEVLKSELEAVEKIVREKMIKAVKLDVPIEVEIGTGKSWFEAH